MKIILLLGFIVGCCYGMDKQEGQDFYDLCKVHLQDAHIKKIATFVKELKKVPLKEGIIDHRFPSVQATLHIQEQYVDIYRLNFPGVPADQSTIRLSFDEMLKVDQYIELKNKR